MGAHNSQSYAAMRMSAQAFSSAAGAGNPAGIQYASGALNQSMGHPLQNTVNSSIDLSNSALMAAGPGVMNNTSGSGSLVTRA